MNISKLRKIMQKEIKLNLEEMSQAGVHFGHKVSKLHPKMKPFISGIKNNVHTFDLEKTSKELEKALRFISKLAYDGKVILFAGTKPQLKMIVQQASQDCGMPYVTERWLGGTFTNFETIQKRVEYYKDLEKKRSSGDLDKYTKKERLLFDRELALLKTKFEGIRDMQKLPEAVILFGLDKEITCAREAKKKGVATIALCDTNVDPSIIDYPIPANDDAISAVQYVLDKVRDVIMEAKQAK